MGAVGSIGGCPLVVRTDRGTENNVVAILERYIRRDGRPTPHFITYTKRNI